MEFTLYPVENLQLNVNYALTNAKYKEWTSTYAGAGGVLQTVDLTYRRLANTPRHQLSGTVRFTFPVAKKYGEPSLALSYYYQSLVGGSRVANPVCGTDGLLAECLYTDRENTVAGYTLLNLRAEWNNVMDTGADLLFFVDNLADKKRYSGYLTAYQAANLGYKSAIPAPPRMWGVQLRLPFGA
jgi:iron complex outermembrane receptor protein